MLRTEKKEPDSNLNWRPQILALYRHKDHYNEK
jgi:potassium/chloride transporter 4/5/6